MGSRDKFLELEEKLRFSAICWLSGWCPAHYRPSVARTPRSAQAEEESKWRWRAHFHKTLIRQKPLYTTR